MNEERKNRYAGFWIRFVAALLDMILLGIPIILFVSIFFGFDWLFGGSLNLRAEFLNLFTWTVITVFLWVNWDGKTPGKKLMGIKIVSYPDHRHLTYSKSLIRYIIGYTISSLIIGLGFIMIAFREDKRGLHDLIAKTCVIYEK